MTVQAGSSNLPTMTEYQQFTLKTDQNPKTGYAGLRLPLLGLFGEVGGLLSELKKKQRDRDSYVAYSNAVMEELGDVIWYFSNIVQRANLSMDVLAQRILRELKDRVVAEGRRCLTFGDIQSPYDHKGPVSDGRFEKGVIALAGKVGRLLDEVSSQHIETNSEALSTHLVEILKAIVEAADDADVSLEEAVKRNMDKVTGRWPIDRVYPPPFDNRFDGDEQLPRRIEMLVSEKTLGDKTFVIQKCMGIKIGDRLTDNRAEKDDYRFHDAFHLANAAILAWSPVIRALFKVKRKSNPKIDETEDGARAIVIEEGVTTWIFNHAVRQNYFATIRSLDFSLLKAIKELVKGYEVEACPLWLWEEAILEGYKVFRFLKENRRGLVTADLSKRKISVEPA
jgi:NTP pyrophosphatase (non-canonical NTP hydrolase)